MTLDELLLEWSYRSEKGYPCLDNPSDISVLKQILKELDLPTDDILDKLEDTPGGDDITHSGTDGMEDSPVEKEKEKQLKQKTQSQSKEQQDLIKIIDDKQEPVLNLSSEELENLSNKINAADELNEDSDKDTIESTEEGLIQQIKNAN